jgi:hypothetical protein
MVVILVLPLTLEKFPKRRPEEASGFCLQDASLRKVCRAIATQLDVEAKRSAAPAAALRPGEALSRYAS